VPGQGSCFLAIDFTPSRWIRCPIMIFPKCNDRYICLIYLAYMKTTLNIDDQILRKASKLTGITEKTTLVRKGLEALIAQESAKRLAALGGSEKKLKSIPRR
jgi:Arc/MetJ family transcription regulator